MGSNKNEKRKPKSAVYRSFWASVVYFHLRLISTKSHKGEMTRNQFVGNHTRVRIPPAAPENGAMSMFIGMAPLFIVLTPTAFFLALPPAFGQLLGQCKGLFHHGGAQLFRLGIQMGVDVGRGGDIAVSQPFLYLLHGHTLLQQQAGAGVP